MVQFKVLLNYGKDNRLISMDTMDAIEKRSDCKSIIKDYAGSAVKAHRGRVITPKEFQKIFDNINPDSQHVRDFWMIGWHTGLRKVKILGLKWDDIKGRWIHFEESISHKRHPRKVFINDALFEYLSNHPRLANHKAGETIITYRGKSIQTISKGIQAAAEKAGITWGRDVTNGITYHDLRHSFKTHSRKAKIDPRLRDLCMGHSTLNYGQSNVYDAIDDEDLVEAMDDLLEWRLAHPDGNGKTKVRTHDCMHFGIRPKLKVVSSGRS